MTLRKREDTGNSQKNTSAHCPDHSHWKRLWTCPKNTR